MRNKSKLSKAISRTKDFKRYLKLKDQVEVIEKELKDSYDKRRMNQEKEAWNKMKRDPKAFFKYAKKFSKSTSDIGHFIDQNGDVVTNASSITEMLRNQYESVYSVPMDESFQTSGILWS